MNAERTIPTCYRHPDRETRLACSNCERPVCVECARQAPVGQKCPECANPRGREGTVRADQLAAAGRAGAPVTSTILALCVGIYVLGMLSEGLGTAVFQLGAQVNPAVAAGEWYRLFTAAFLHSPAAITHILFNMFALYLFGPQLERQAGSVPFAALYVSAAVSGGAVFYLLNPGGVAVGASGAIFGLFGAWLAAAFRNRHTAAGAAGLRQLLLLLGINAVLPFVVPAIAWEAHLGGLVAGFAIASAWLPVARRARPGLARTLVAAGVGGGALLLVIVG